MLRGAFAVDGRWALRALVALTCALVSTIATAQPERDADALFARGRELMAARKYPEACEALAESERLSPSVGALGLLAACHEAIGQKARAHGEYLQAAERARQAGDEREAYSRRRAAALQAVLPVLSFRVESAPAGLTLRCDGIRVDPAQPLAVDSGAHQLQASAPEHRAWTVQIAVAERERRTIVIPGLARDPSNAPPQPGTAAPPAAPPPPDDSAGDGQRTAGFVAIGVGAAGLVAALITGGLVVDRNSTVQDECPGSTCRSQQGFDAAEQGKTLLLVNAIAWAVAAVGMGGGSALVLTAPSGARAAQGKASLRLGGSF